MKVFFRSIVQSGLRFATSTAEKRGIVLANEINLILFALAALLTLFYWAYYPVNVVTYMIPLIGTLCLSGIALNRFGFTGVARINTSVFVPLATLVLSIHSKSIYYATQADLDYFTFRFVILGTSVLPAILFTTRERLLLIACLSFNLLILMLYDPFHAMLGVPYVKNGIDPYYYYFANVVILVSYLVQLGSLLFLKINLERTDRKNQSLLQEMLHVNEELKKQKDEIEAQSDALSNNQNKLLDAYSVIEQQKEQLSHQNKSLAIELLEKNEDLLKSNTELIKYNNELRQFSYTISHNLRGPVASLLGLLTLLDKKSQTEENKKIISFIDESTARLDAIIRDLSKIIDIRNDIFRVRQKVHLISELEEIRQLFTKKSDASPVTFHLHLSECPEIYSIKPMVHSILYNLISNAIKYKAPDRHPEISITSTCTEDYYIFTVVDNGLGIDLPAHSENLFKLYKRFHYHTEGKGMGLYLVKLQCEALGGYIEVESQLNQFTRFTVYLKKPENIERQVLYDQEAARIFFDASINATGVIWKGPVTSEQYRDVFVKSLDFLKAFHAPNYLADLTHQGPISEEDQTWMFKSIIPDAIQSGMKRIASVKPEANSPLVRQYLEGINTHLHKRGATYEMFTTLDEATTWIRQANELDLTLKQKAHANSA